MEGIKFIDEYFESFTKVKKRYEDEIHSEQEDIMLDNLLYTFEEIQKELEEVDDVKENT